MFQRRSILMGMGAVVLAPAVVRADSIMSVKAIDRLALRGEREADVLDPFTIYGWDKMHDAGFRRSDPDATQKLPIAMHLTQSWKLSW